MEVSGVFIGIRSSVERKYSGICPYPTKKLESLVSQCLLKTWFTAAVGFLTVVTANRFIEGRFTVYSVLAGTFLAIILLNAVPDIIIRKCEELFLSDLLSYFSSVKRKFIYKKNIPDAVGDGAGGFGEEIVRNASELEKILVTDNRREAVRRYIENRNKNKFLKLFLIQAFETSENGDAEFGGESSFSKNIEFLRLEVINEIYREKKKRYMFSGYMFVAVFPVLSMGIVRRVGLALTDSLSLFYEGTGAFIILLSFLSAWFVMSVLKDNSTDIQTIGSEKMAHKKNSRFVRIGRRLENFVESSESNVVRRLRGKIYVSGRRIRISKLLLEMILISCIVLTVGLFFLFLQRGNERDALLEKVENIDRIAVLARDNVKKGMEYAILESVKDVISSGKTNITYSDALSLFRSYMGNVNSNYEEECVNEILSRTAKYRGLYVKWYEGAIVLAVSLITGFLPVFRLNMDSSLRKRASVDEIKRFQTIIMMERGFDSLSVVGLLTDLELFADVFKPELKEAVNTYSAGPNMALQRMKQKGTLKNPAFSEIADGFIAVDEVGICEAFSDAAGNKECLERMDELSETISAEKKKGFLDIVVWIPGILVIFGYFVVPFMKNSLSELSELFSLLENPGAL